MLLHHVEVVEQPFAGGAHVPLAIGGGRQTVVRVLEDVGGVAEPRQKARLGLEPALLGHTLRRGERTRALGQVLGAQQLAADGTGHQLFGTADGAGETAGEQRE